MKMPFLLISPKIVLKFLLIAKGGCFKYTDPFLSSDFHGQEADGTGEFTRYYEYFYDQLEMEYLKQDFRHDGEILELILRLIVEVMCSNRKQIRIASDDKPVEIVRSTFMKLDSEHIRFVIDRFKENTTEVRNIKQYLLASIYNAPYTIDVLTHNSPVGDKGERTRLFLGEVGYQKALAHQKAGDIKIISHAAVAKGNLYYDRRDMAR